MLKPSKLLDNILKYTITAILIAVPLFPKFPFIKIPGTFVSIRLEDLVLAFSFCLVLIYIIPQIKIFSKKPINKAIIIFLTVGFVSVVSGILLTKTAAPHIGILHWLRRIEYLVPLYLGAISIRRNRANLDYYFKVILLVLLFTFIYGFGQKYFNWPIIITQNQEYSQGVALRYVPGGHINSTFAGHYDLATYLVLLMPILVAGIFSIKEKLSKLILFPLFFSAMWLLVNTASRISLAAYLISVTLAMILIRKFKALVAVIIFSLIFVAFSSSLIARYERIFDVLDIKTPKLINSVGVIPVMASESSSVPVKRIFSPTPTPVPVFEDRSTNIRLNVEWPRALRAFYKNPLLGTGYSSITLATDNEYLRLLGETGILGFLAFSLVFMNIATVFLRSLPFYKNYQGIELAFIAGVCASIPGIFLNAVFIDVFEASKFAILFWLILGFTLGLLGKDIYEENN